MYILSYKGKNKAAILLAASKGRVYEKVLYHICDDINITDNFEQTLSISLKKDKISKVFITLFMCIFPAHKGMPGEHNVYSSSLLPRRNNFKIP